MTNEMLSKIIGNQVSAVFRENQKMITEQLAACVEEGEEVDPVTAKMVVSAMMLSSRIAVQIVIQYLDKIGVIELPDFPTLRVVDNEQLL